MVNRSLLLATALGLLAAFTPAFGQDALKAEGCTTVCTDTATSIQACGEYNAECICSAEVIAQVADCGKCLTDAGLTGGDYNVVGDHTELCKTLGMVDTSTTTSTSASLAPSETAEVPAAIANVANAATPPSNGAAMPSLNMGLGFIAAVVGLAMSGAQL
ncbi:hypothetical protein FA13DRAFT_1729170 [Coprinellus micaceus]|uniref:Extracellular membrane protein CFEM domain-containing protein n=1 Tax=Coprinellus micaceus TaxID=71717 RepID=A0A4Y7TKR7_COPMI|nr:hypothetical protein FA13DRAFT_1729170 [Coprinellus micaceus]